VAIGQLQPLKKHSSKAFGDPKPVQHLISFG